jgi:hydroxymethylpyrimidine kinase / phosphomethylpyrimidine kinase / thiamine-phosphate diphosphorylase
MQENMEELFLTGYGLAVRVRDTRLVFKQGINDPFGRENIEFGASRHTASAIIGYMRVNPPIRSVINIRFNDELVKICKNLFSVLATTGARSPRGTRKKGGSSVTWGTLQAPSKNPRADIIIYHKGDIGKEAMIITVFGKNPGKVAAKIKEKY